MGQFERFEYKYVTTRAQAEDFKRAILPYMSGDSHNSSDGSYEISSLYFDNIRHELFYQTKNRTPFRQKLRLRIYGEAQLTGQSFFEVKNKLNGKTFKNRICLPLDQAMLLYENAANGLDCGNFYKYIRSSSESVALEEVIRVIARYSLNPSAVVSYNREAYFCPDLTSLRITFDSALRVRYSELDLSLGSYGIPVMGDDEVVIEVKCNHNIPIWLSQSLGVRRLMNRSFSKYCSLGLAEKKTAEREMSVYLS